MELREKSNPINAIFVVIVGLKKEAKKLTMKSTILNGYLREKLCIIPINIHN
jgi:hypothetical protein